MSLVEIENLHVSFRTDEGTANVINGVDLEVEPGEVVCILGESGSGKSVTLRALMQLLPKRRTTISGRIRVAEHDILSLDERKMADLRGPTVAMIFQEPMTAFDPVFTVGTQIVETIKRHEKISEREAEARALELFERVRIPSPKARLKNYPFEMSGGMRQRAMIALALSCRPSLLLADEPTTALDATVQIQILLLLRELQQELGMAIMFVTHDIGVAVEVGDRIAVMYAGRFVEMGSTREVFSRPAHPYTKGLMASTVHGDMKGQRMKAIDGSPPDLTRLLPGCAFEPRCGERIPVCRQVVPAIRTAGPGHTAACVHVGAPAKELA
ncbi:ABC transporter ATP-binding protein [Acuticoccus mangrovi]|uniref:ABC transporter ATP-binding protein n=1 Tax=Acuticoccus mangrovi TaxID=2796142 RepID=A0A934MMI8_9HYPH|nr:ABC transporter ATP-binding protein [Acuticoccus mangrovi]MBJ3777299.1 ABC transporter ATP-binding protein [Acuticoccus mangrovi]